jgi:hypothetical protein
MHTHDKMLEIYSMIEEREVVKKNQRTAFFICFVFYFSYYSLSKS